MANGEREREREQAEDKKMEKHRKQWKRQR